MDGSSGSVEARKDDAGKLRVDLIPVDSLLDVAAIYTFGAKKYADDNWRKGLSWKRIYAAVLRHLWAFWLREDNDSESGLPHLAHAAWGLLTLLNYSKERREFDDRPVPNRTGSKIPAENPLRDAKLYDRASEDDIERFREVLASIRKADDIRFSDTAKK